MPPTETLLSPATLDKLDKPSGASALSSIAEPAIHVIPDEFYGVALKKKAPPLAPPPPPAPAVPQPPKPPVPPARKKKSPAVLIIVILLLIIAIGGGAAWYFFLRPQPVVKPPVVNAPPKAVCGDNKCDAAESWTTCSADCPQPGPVCGDGICDSAEGYSTCSADCPKPAPVCGDDKCEAPDETFENCAADCQPPEPAPAADADSDGLTDDEEKNIYQTDILAPDTDGDSFVDLNEVINLFDPAKPRPSMLSDNPGIAAYSNAAQGYKAFRPSSWTLRESGEGATEAYFTAPTGEFIEIMAEPNAEKKPLLDWYLAQVPDVKSSEIQIFKTRGGYDEILSPDRMTAYVAVGDKVLVVSYNLGDQLLIRYKATFQTVVSSLVVTGQ